jgi:hypothetical protein
MTRKGVEQNMKNGFNIVFCKQNNIIRFRPGNCKKILIMNFLG